MTSSRTNLQMTRLTRQTHLALLEWHLEEVLQLQKSERRKLNHYLVVSPPSWTIIGPHIVTTHSLFINVWPSKTSVKI
ncbi:BgTH12-06073 [Blumeria graminis f. sp. triticale]|uniref:BgTH12-06073 n=1 Tax=Blumeria graminis f. sp. triticale TaxID=1689686 RepID=A0A9W4D5Q2_BLUGR|nr:BgTH12-06073 [Blumeria graminis f. sp. triticale]